jgi:hypothetical protein
MTDYTGKKIAEASCDKEEIIYAEYDFDENAKQREYWGLLRDRQCEMYTCLCDKKSCYCDKWLNLVEFNMILRFSKDILVYTYI